jgi:prepilin-type N-terminal cleavage/methylation domain-containing protein
MQNAEGRMKELRQPLLGSLSSLQVDAIALVNRHPDSAFCLLPSAFARRGLTLIELMISIMILSFTVAALGMMSRAVEISSEYNQGYGTATQHARVTLDRLDRAVNQAYANSSWAGVWVTGDTIGSWNFPDTLVVWRPNGTPADPQGAPIVSELVLFCPNPTSTNQFQEITLPGDNRTLPSASNAATFKAFIDGLKTAAGANKVLLTDLVRTVVVSGSAQPKAAVRFVVAQSPTDAQMLTYPSVTWQNLPWPQGICSPTMGVRQVWLRTEIQLLPAGNWSITNAAGEQAVPYFESSSFCYTVIKP